MAMSKDAVTLHLETVRSGGNVYQYRRLRWYDEMGKRRGKRLGRVEDIGIRQAKKLRDAKAAELERRPGRRADVYGLAEYIDLYISQREAADAADKTLALYGQVKRLLLAGFEADTPIDRIDKMAAFTWWSQLSAGQFNGVSQWHENRARSMGPSRLATILRTVKAMFNRAVELELLELNPFARVKPAKPAAAAWRYVPIDEFWRMHAVAEAEDGVGSAAWSKVIALARLAALSREDIELLEWSSVLFVEREIRINRAKTGQPQHVPIGVDLLKLLSAWREERPARIGPGGDRVVDPMPSLGNVGRDVGVIRKHAEVPAYGKPLHTLRKSCIQDWADRGNAMHDVRLWAGHASMVTTQAYYTQARSESMEREKAPSPRAKVSKSDPKSDHNGPGGGVRDAS